MQNEHYPEDAWGNLSREDRLSLARSHWKRPDVQKEWGGDYEKYMAYHQAMAAGLVKIFGSGRGLSKHSIDEEAARMGIEGRHDEFTPDWDPKPHGFGYKPPTEDEKADPEAKVKWDADPSLRDEFSGDFEAFQSYHAADKAGQVKYAPVRHRG